MTPSILPDNTIRLAIDGTVSTIVNEVPAQSGGGGTTVTNFYPVVNEAHLVNLSRVPSGYSLLLGGFVTIDNSVSTNKVPVLGSIPLLGQAFRYKQVNRTRTNLAFIITPVAFNAGSPEQSVEVSEHVPGGYHWSERDLADPALIGRVNENATDFHNALSTGQYQESDKNPVNRHRKKPKKQYPAQDSVPEPQSASWTTNKAENQTISRVRGRARGRLRLKNVSRNEGSLSNRPRTRPGTRSLTALTTSDS